MTAAHREALAEAQGAKTLINTAIATCALMSKPLDEPLPEIIRKLRQALTIARDQIGRVAEYLDDKTEVQ